MLTQIIPADSLTVLNRQLHEIRALWNIPQLCGCALSKEKLPSQMERDICKNIMEKNLINNIEMNLSSNQNTLKTMYPNVPFDWLCDGKLLQLNEPKNIKNYNIFQDQWKCGKPILISNISKTLNIDLWKPESFVCEFDNDDKNNVVVDDKRYDIINCITGKIIQEHGLKEFWNGFDCVGRRLKDENGVPMLLKLKDWPPCEDFADILPRHFTDFMNALPLTEYTHRQGCLNLVSHLPNLFVKPDLGPKMYCSYGSTLYPSKGIYLFI